MVMKTLQLCAVVLITILSVSCGKKDQQAMTPPPVQVTTQKVNATDARYYDEYPAVVKALNEVELRPQVNGYITAIHFVEGSAVRKGQKLYSIDQQQYAATHQQAVANLAVQEANLVKAERDVQRYRELDKSEAIAKQQVDYAEAAYAAAQKQVEAAKAAVQGVQTNVRYTTITAPFDGTIGLSAVRLGAAVSAGQTLLNTISSDNPIAADITVDQREIFRFAQLQAKATPKNDSTFRLAFGNDIYPAAGKISVVDRAVDAQTGTIKVRLVFPNNEHLLRPGMSASLRVLSAASASAVLVPYKAVTEQLGEFFVYLVGDDNKATQRKVQLGRQIGKDVIIESGLKANDTIVVEGVQNVREGSMVAVAAPGAPAAAGTAEKK
jgi:membrane fusion protein, multidrug efflux system